MRPPYLPLVIVGLLTSYATAVAQDQPLICFGNEPFWRLDLTEAGKASFSTPDSSPADFLGAANTLQHRGETIWRGRATAPERGDLVAFLREGACSDSMSDTTHPFSVSVSMPDGRHLAGCCRVTQVAMDSAALENRTWRLTAMPGHTLRDGQGPDAVTVNFDAGRVHGFSGCNQFVGSYAVEGQQLVLGKLAGTMMACPEPAMAIEQGFMSAFSGTLTIALSGNELSLTPPGDGEALRFKQAAAPQLEGVEWEVTGYNNGRQAVVGVALGSRITLMFRDGMVSGNSGCNQFSGPFVVDGDALQIQSLRTTRRACEPGLMTQEEEFLAALQSATTWTVFRGMLDVHRADGERVLTASPVDQ